MEMGRKTEPRLVNEIETTASSMLICDDLKREEIIKNVKFLQKYGYTTFWWYENQLPIILKKLGITHVMKGIAKSGH